MNRIKSQDCEGGLNTDTQGKVDKKSSFSIWWFVEIMFKQTRMPGCCPRKRTLRIIINHATHVYSNETALQIVCLYFLGMILGVKVASILKAAAFHALPVAVLGPAPDLLLHNKLPGDNFTHDQCLVWFVFYSWKDMATR